MAILDGVQCPQRMRQISRACHLTKLLESSLFDEPANSLQIASAKLINYVQFIFSSISNGYFDSRAICRDENKYVINVKLISPYLLLTTLSASSPLRLSNREEIRHGALGVDLRMGGPTTATGLHSSLTSFQRRPIQSRFFN